MEREIDLKKISDGKLYTNKDMVKAGCGECQGCSDCCRGMGNSIFLDPMDIYRLTTGLECTFEDLLSTCVELQVVDGFIQPNMKMTGKEEQCPFLNEKGRCNIHAIRPGICRLFPLGRCYDGEGGLKTGWAWKKSEDMRTLWHSGTIFRKMPGRCWGKFHRKHW